MWVQRISRTSDQKTNRIFENIFGVEESEYEIIFQKLGFFMWVQRESCTSDQKNNRIFENIFGVEESEYGIFFRKYAFFMWDFFLRSFGREGVEFFLYINFTFFLYFNFFFPPIKPRESLMGCVCTPITVLLVFFTYD